MTGNVGRNVTLRPVRVTIITVENKKYITHPKGLSAALLIQNAIWTRLTILSYVVYVWFYHILDSS